MKVKIIDPKFLCDDPEREWKKGDFIELGKKQTLEAIEKGYVEKIIKEKKKTKNKVKKTKEKELEEKKSSARCWDVFPKENGIFTIENHETEKNVCIDFKTEIGRHSAFGLMKEIGLSEIQRGKVWDEIYKLKQKVEKPTKIEVATKEFTDYLEMADRFIRIQPTFYTPQKIWWLWNFETKAWKMVDEIDLLNEISESIEGPALFKPQTKSEVLNALKMRGRLATPKEADKNWIQLKEKIYDIKTGIIFEASPTHFVTNPIPHSLGETEETPNIDRLFREWVDEKDVPTLYEILAYSMLPNYPLHRVFCLNGEGRNGKGTFLQILTNFVGKENVCSTDFDTLISRPFEAAKLYKKLVCVMGEINAAIFKRTSLFKKLTGSDIIGYEFKGKDGFDDYNYAKLLIATNKLPESTDKTVGFFSRWLIIDFNNRFKEKPDLLDCIPPEEYGNLARKCLRILRNLLEKAEFTGEGSIEERMERYEERASPFKEFLHNCCELDEYNETPFWELYEEYEAYIEERGFRKPSKRELSHLVKNHGLETKRVNYEKSNGEKSTMIVVEGIGLHHSYSDAEKQQKEEFGGLRGSK